MVAQPWNGPSSATPPDVWHVLIAPGETKILSLEQLDDFFRLEVIDASTKVWQPGMKEWLPLSVVAGLEDDAEEELEVSPVPARPAPRPPAPPSRAPAPPSSRAPAPPRKPPQVAVAPMPVAVAPVHAPVPAPSFPPQAAQRPAPVAVSPWPAAVAPQSFAPASVPPATRSLPPSYAPPESTRPFVMGVSVPPPPPRGSRFGSFLLGVATLAAVGITLYRNDVLRDVAKSAGQESAYSRVERALGSPGFGTPRAVAHLAELPTLSVPDLAAMAPAPRVRETPTSVVPTTPVASASADEATGSSSTKSQPDAPSTEVPKSLESLVAAKVAAEPKRAARSAQRVERAPAKRASSRAEPEAKSLGIKGSTNKFDPLNGKL